jgi:hypothetical protein
LLLISLSVACQRGKQPAESRQAVTFKAERSNFFNGLLAPAELARQLRAAFPEFHREFMSDPKMYSHYAANEVKAAMNLGIYLSDLNYSVAYARPEITKEYFEAAYELSKAAGIEKRILEFLKVRYEANLSKNDSVKAVIDDLLSKSTRDLQGTRKERLAGIAMAAYQIENLHLAIALLQLQSKDTLPINTEMSLFPMIGKQRGNVTTIYNFLTTYSDPLDPDTNPNYPYYANTFVELLSALEKFENSERNANSVTSATTELREKVDAIRNKMTSIE